jgi:hypothetical protein
VANRAVNPASQNELAMLELIHCFVEVLDKHFGQVCELDIMNEPDMVRRPAVEPVSAQDSVSAAHLSPAHLKSVHWKHRSKCQRVSATWLGED